MDKKVKVGIIGIGNMGTGHYNNIMNGYVPEMEVSAVCDINPARLDYVRNDYQARKEKGEELSEIFYFDNASEMIKSGKIDAVIVAVPHYFHPVYVIEAIENGVHVMSEKPAGVYTNAVKKANEVSKQHPEVVFGLMFNQRTDPAYKKMKEIIDSGELGAIRRTNWIITTWYRSQRYYDSGSWRATWSGEGGGVLLNQCPHQLDLFQWICGMPVKVMSKLSYGKWHDIEVEDDVTAFLEYENGATGTFITSTSDCPGTNRFEILCEKGKLVYENGILNLKKLNMSITDFTYSKEIKASWGEPQVIFNENLDISGPNTQHVGVLNAFAARILRGEPLIAEGTEGIRSLTLSNAMHLSSWLGREVEIPFDEDLYEEELMKRVATSRRKPEFESAVTVQWENKK